MKLTPRSTAARQSSRFVIPQIFILTIDQFPEGRFEIGRAHQHLPDEETIGAGKSFDVSSRPDAAFGHAHRRLNERQYLFSLIEVHGKRIEIARIDADNTGIQTGTFFEFVLLVYLYETIETELPRVVIQKFQGILVEYPRDEKYHVGPL